MLKGLGVTLALAAAGCDDAGGHRRRPVRARARRRCGWWRSRWCTARPAAPRSASRRTCGRRRRRAPRSTCRRAASSRSRRIRDHITIISNTDVRQGRGVHHAGDWRRPLPLERGVPHPGAPEADPGLGRVRRHLAGPDVRAGATGRTRRFRRCSCASRTWTSPAAAPTATRAPTPIQSAGRRPRSRCRWCATRAWCSTRCSASAPRPASGASGASRIRACWTGCRRRSAR